MYRLSKTLLLSTAAAALILGSTEANATLQIAVDVGGTLFLCADNAACDQNPATGQINTGFQTINGVTFEGTSQQQTIGPPQNQLNTSSFQITNGNAFTVAIQFAESAIGFTGPVSAIDSSGSATFTNAIGTTYGMMFFADAANTQGANTPTDLPGTQLTSSAFTVANAADSTSFSQADPFSASGLYSMSLSTTVSLTAGAEVIGRNQAEIAEAVPEPASLAIFGTALLGFGVVGWLRRRKDGKASISGLSAA